MGVEGGGESVGSGSRKRTYGYSVLLGSLFSALRIQKLACMQTAAGWMYYDESTPSLTCHHSVSHTISYVPKILCFLEVLKQICSMYSG